MKFSKFIVIPIIIAVLAAIAQLIDQGLQSAGSCDYFISNSGFCWVAFQAWAVYFFGGCTLKTGIKAFVAYVIGIVASIIIIVFAGVLGSAGVPAFWCVPLSLLILVIPVICLELKNVMIPALFIGAGAFFAIMTYQPAGDQTTFLNAACTEIIYTIIGLGLGWITIFLRAKYEACVAENGNS